MLGQSMLPRQTACVFEWPALSSTLIKLVTCGMHPTLVTNTYCSSNSKKHASQAHECCVLSASLLPQAPFSDALRLWLLYQTWMGQLLLWLPVTWWVLTWQHHRIARHADSPKSKKDIPALIKVLLL